MRGRITANALRDSLKSVLVNAYHTKNGRRNHVIDNPTLRTNPYRFLLGRRTSFDLWALAVLSWYFPDQSKGINLRFDLEEELSRREDSDRISIQNGKESDLFIYLARICLESEPHTVLFLLETNLWHSDEWFGNFLNKIKLAFLKLKVRIENLDRKLCKKKVFRRGYDDHGSYNPLASIRRSARNRFEDSQEMYAIYSNRDTVRDTISLIVSSLE